MKDKEMHSIVKGELEQIPRGDLFQNLYRMVFAQARFNGLGDRAGIPATSDAARAFARRTVQRQNADFVPVSSGQDSLAQEVSS